MTTIGDCKNSEIYYDIKKKQHGTQTNNGNIAQEEGNAPEENLPSSPYSYNGEDMIGQYNKVLLDMGGSRSSPPSNHPFVENPEEFLKGGFEPSIFSDENMEKIFPSDQYNIEKSNGNKGENNCTFYKITNKKGEDIVKIEINENNEYIFYYKTEDGNIKSYDTHNGFYTGSHIYKGTKTEYYNSDGIISSVYDHETKILYIYDRSGSFIASSLDDEDRETFYTLEGYIDRIVEPNGRTTYYYPDGNIKEILERKENGRVIFYNPDGSIRKTVESPESISELIGDEISKTNALGIPTTAENLEEIIKTHVTPKNVMEIMSFYKEKNGEYIFTAIFNEIGLPPEERARIGLYLKDQIISYYKSQGVYTDDIDAEMTTYINTQAREIGIMNADGIIADKEVIKENWEVVIEQNGLLERLEARKNSPSSNNEIAPNGEIDEDFFQGYTGDCWLVAAIKSIASSAEGLAILNDMISVDEKGNVTVTFKHLNKTYHISKEELLGADELASGDLDVRALEIAYNKFFHEKGYTHWIDIRNENDDITDGGYPSIAYALILGTANENFYPWNEIESDEDFKAFIEKVKSGEILACAAILGMKGEDITAKALDKDGKEVELISIHAYAVVGADDKYVYIVNPWDTSQVLKVTFEDFRKNFNNTYSVSKDSISNTNPNISQNEPTTENSTDNENDLTIDGDELEGVEIIAKAGEKIIIKDGYSFKAITDASGNIYYRVQDQDGNITYISKEVFDKIIKNGQKNGVTTNIKDILEDYAVNNPQDVSEELIGFNWNDVEQKRVTNALEKTFGKDYVYVVTYNFDGSFNYIVYNQDGKIIYNPNDDKPVSLIDLANIQDPTKLFNYEWTDEEKNEVLKQLSEHFGSKFSYYVTFNPDGTFNYAVFDNKSQTGYFDGVGLGIADYTKNGMIDVDKLIKDWQKKGGQVYNYDGNSTQIVYNALLKGEESNNYNNFWKSAAYYDDDPFEDIDKFQFISWVHDDEKSANIGESDGGGGGGAGGGGANRDAYGNLDWKNAGLSLLDALEGSTSTNRSIITEDSECEE